MKEVVSGELLKGERIEEQLRRYFLERGFFVLRAAKFKFDGMDITDVDLWLYHKSSVLSRERIIVDIKNKKSPQAIERIFWAHGLMLALRANSCIVATTERRESIRRFGKLNNVTILDGHFLGRLKALENDRLTEEDFLYSMKEDGEFDTVNDYRKRYEAIKTAIIANIDFSSANLMLKEIKFFFEQVAVNPQRKIIAYRILLCAISYFLIMLDFILRDLAFLDNNERSEKIDDGFKFGNLGKDGIERTLDLAMRITNQTSAAKNKYLQQYDTLPVKILREYFSKLENSNNLFNLAKGFEFYAFSTDLKMPEFFPVEIKSIFLVLLDFNGLDRKKFISEILS